MLATMSGDVQGSCPFCSTGSIIDENDHAMALLDGYPISEGHTLVVPREHAASVFDLEPGAQAALWQLVHRARERMLADGADGVNIGINDGTAAGQTVMHAHIHVIPRRTGDVPDPRGGIRWVLADKAAYVSPPPGSGPHPVTKG